MCADDVVGVRQPLRSLHDLQPVIDVQLHDGELDIIELAGLVQDLVADADLADVMKECALDQRANLFAAQAGRLGEMGGVERHAIVVRVGIAVAVRDRAAEHLHRLQIGGEQAFREVRQPAGQPEDDRVHQQARCQDDQGHVAGSPHRRASRARDGRVGQRIKAFAVGDHHAAAVRDGPTPPGYAAARRSPPLRSAAQQGPDREATNCFSQASNSRRLQRPGQGALREDGSVGFVEANEGELPVTRDHAMVGLLVERALDGCSRREARFLRDGLHPRLEPLDAVDRVRDGILTDDVVARQIRARAEEVAMPTQPTSNRSTNSRCTNAFSPYFDRAMAAWDVSMPQIVVWGSGWVQRASLRCPPIRGLRDRFIVLRETMAGRGGGAP